MKPTVVYILGSGHSGSTVLQYLLASRPGVLGIGEVRQMASGRGWSDDAGACSCGEAVESCRLWKHSRPHADEGPTAWYERLVQTTRRLYPGYGYWIDSSKDMDGLAAWQALARAGMIEDVRVIYLSRDMRGWAVSDGNTRKRKDRPLRPILISMLAWWRNQRRFQRFLSTEEIAALFISYERLVFDTAAVMGEVTSALGLEATTDWESALGAAEVHDVFGNRMKDDPRTRTRLTYDDGWQQRGLVSLLAPLLVPAWRMNKSLREAPVDWCAEEPERTRRG